jgi:CubicO group peptidase (beta-lactamase class C family)
MPALALAAGLISLQPAALRGVAAQAPHSAQAALPETPEAFGTVFRDFATRNNLASGVIVVRRGGRVVFTDSIGGTNPTKPAMLASLSKAITAACVATLVRDGKLSLDTPLSVAMRRFLATVPPVAHDIGAITVAQLISHRSGLAGNRGDGEAATGRSLLELIRAESAGESAHRALGRRILSLGLKRRPGEYQYSNDGYALLGLVIEEADGRPYEEACRERVLVPAGAGGNLAEGWALIGPFGGWALSGESYLRFLDSAVRDNRLVGEAAGEWWRGGAGTSPAAGARWYGLGLNTRLAGSGFNTWHWGAWRFAYRPTDNAPLVRASFRTLAVRVQDGTSWFIRMEPEIDEAAAQKLDPELFRAYRSVTRW